MTFTGNFLTKSVELLNQLDEQEIEAAVSTLSLLRQRQGRLFLIGSGGGAGHASHAACDFRKLCNIEAYAPYDNISELTARVNDEGWDLTIVNWLKVSRFAARDGLFVFSVGGGSEQAIISMNLVNAVKYAKELGATVSGVVGKDGGYSKQAGDAVIVLPVVQGDLVTPLTEGFQSVIWHLIVSHPMLQVNAAKWESVEPAIVNLQGEVIPK
jgi:D-sedoheptulose 7-phosphate isomerase